MQAIGCYIHIPFCQKKCYYCDFTAFPNLENRIAGYIENLKKEIILYKSKLDLKIDSIYIGGGTPSYIDPTYIEDIINFLREFDMDIKEFTIECNPNSIDKHKLRVYKNLGINRISLGVQSFDDRVLEKIGRNHNKKVALEDINLIKEYGFDLSIDMMLNLPIQDEESVKTDLSTIKNLDLDHISYYSLILERGSHFYSLYKNNKLDLMDDDTEVEIFDYIIEYLKECGFDRYEISNFAKNGKESYHNKKYWQEEGYLGLGLGASGFLSNNRYTNVKNFIKYENYLNKNILPIENKEYISIEEREKEYIIFKLREVRGINLAEFKEKFSVDFLMKYADQISKFKDQDFYKIDTNFYFTKKGMSLSNEFFVEII